MPDVRDDFEKGYDARMVGDPFVEQTTDEWKRGWNEAKKNGRGIMLRSFTFLSQPSLVSSSGARYTARWITSG